MNQTLNQSQAAPFLFFKRNKMIHSRMKSCFKLKRDFLIFRDFDHCAPPRSNAKVELCFANHLCFSYLLCFALDRIKGKGGVVVPRDLGRKERGRGGGWVVGCERWSSHHKQKFKV